MLLCPLEVSSTIQENVSKVRCIFLQSTGNDKIYCIFISFCSFFVSFLPGCSRLAQTTSYIPLSTNVIEKKIDKFLENQINNTRALYCSEMLCFLRDLGHRISGNNSMIEQVFAFLSSISLGSGDRQHPIPPGIFPLLIIFSFRKQGVRQNFLT